MPYAWEFYEDGRWFSVVVNGPLIIDDKEMMRRAALNGVGIGFGVEQAIADDIKADGWCRCWSNGPRRFRDYSFAIRNSGKCRPRCGPSSMR